MSLNHEELSNWYQQLAQQLEAGRPLAEALRAADGTGNTGAAANTMAQVIEQGGSIDDALQSVRTWLPEADTLFLAAAAESGRLPRILQRLSDHHGQIRAIKLQVVFACAYPAAVLHVGLLLLPLRQMISSDQGFVWDPAAYARGLAWTLVPLWTVAALVGAIARRRPRWIRSFGRVVPLVRGYLQVRALADFANALANFLEAGLAIERAWSIAGFIAESLELTKASEAIAAAIARGELPGPHLRAWRCFPVDFSARYQTGESTGQLDGTLFRLSEDYQQRANRRLRGIALVYPTLLLIAVGGVVIVQVVSFYAGYLKSLGELGGP